MSITRFISWLTLALFVVVAGCTTSKPNSEQLDQLVHRTSALEQQVHNLEVSNAELQMQLRALQQRQQPQTPRVPPWIPPQQPSPPRSRPPTNQVPYLTPHLTPLDTK